MGGERSEAEELGRRIKAARTYGDVTQAQLADEIGHDRTTIIRWERGEVDKDYKREILERAAAKLTQMPEVFFSINLQELPLMAEAWNQVRRLPDDAEIDEIVTEWLEEDPPS